MQDHTALVAKALIKRQIPATALGSEVEMFLRGYLVGLISLDDFIECVAEGCRRARGRVLRAGHGSVPFAA